MSSTDPDVREGDVIEYVPNGLGALVEHVYTTEVGEDRVQARHSEGGTVMDTPASDVTVIGHVENND